LGRGIGDSGYVVGRPGAATPVLEPWWDGDGEGHPHSGMFETDRSVAQSRRNAS